MRAWEAVDVPSLEHLGPGPAVSVHNTRSGRVELTKPENGVARIYVCGITPYDATHIGHAATYVAFDLLNRAWLDAGHKVRYVQNVTDVDDPLLERANANGEDWRALADREIELFREDMHALRVLPPAAYVGAVESIPAVIELIQQLQARGVVYELDGDLYFSVHADGRFGTVSQYSEESMLGVFADRGGDPTRPGKKHPLDCMLWMAARPGEPAWSSPFGPGRPGWHVECSSIALTELGENFDVQGGGRDLEFPHHEMSASEAQAAFSGLTFAQSYVHTGMVAYGEEKMSKSKGNLVFVSKLREEGRDPQAIRLALLAHHYRQDWEWTDDQMERAETRLKLWREALPSASENAADQIRVAVRNTLSDDLNAPAALSAIDAWAAGWHHGDGSGSEHIRQVIDARLGILL
ncbi:MAG TPA: cysteine--1-D-myo-inosityl 2-amino-2-deoxy-alpha-D-glucopyranoside ligase [Nocardioidaceae bacterium]|nr:cysteine--1-D-myo-inosityl 2-amino-2-deoxy-alpha-D-glucopyranoside ligase [Nocardioidaceae bacterium]